MLTRLRGNQAEDLACRFLRDKGLSIIERNFSCQYGEIDIIGRDDTNLVFVEVRMRSHSQFGYAEESVQRNKRGKIIRTASYFLQTHGHWYQFPSRFDIIAIDADQHVHWIQAAFTAPAW